MKKINIGYVTNLSPLTYKNWSGIIASQYEMLSQEYNVEWVGSYKINKFLRFRVFLQKLFWKKFLKKNLPVHNKYMAKERGRIITRILKNKEFDFLFVPAATECLSYLETDLPIVYLSDATPENLFEYYPAYSNLSFSHKKDLHFLEKLCLEKSSLIIYTSKWASQSAIDHYKISRDKIKIIPFTPSLPRIPSREELNFSLKKESCNLLFIAANWERKGGEIVFDAWDYLKSKGFNVTLTVVGCEIPEEYKKYVDGDRLFHIGKLHKDSVSDYEKLYNAYLQANFFILPSIADCTPIVFSEANAFGLPIITRDTGGISDIVKIGFNGYVMLKDDKGKEYGNLIESIWHDSDFYIQLRHTSRRFYEEVLSPESWSRNIKKALQEINIY